MNFIGYTIMKLETEGINLSNFWSPYYIVLHSDVAVLIYMIILMHYGIELFLHFDKNYE